MTKKKVETAALILFAVMLVFSASFMGARMGGQGNDAAPLTEPEAEKSARSIAIPGFEEIRMKAGEIRQAVSFYNPPGNDCYFTISLAVDGIEIFASELLAPGEKLTEVTLTQPLFAGIYYDARLTYRSFDLYSMEELNGAEVVTRLEVEK